MNKLDLSYSIFKLSRSVERLPRIVRALVDRCVQSACDRVARVIRAAGTRVRGCRCDDDDPEFCCRQRETNPQYADWCLCDCHNTEITTRTLGEEAN